jgi:hypothetical protein
MCCLRKWTAGGDISSSPVCINDLLTAFKEKELFLVCLAFVQCFRVKKVFFTGLPGTNQRSNPRHYNGLQ